VALLSLPRAEEYRFRVNIGLDGLESVPSRISFCAYTMLGTDLLVVADARTDLRFYQNPLVVGPPHIISYVGAPLVSSRGITLGTLCAIDHQPRTFTSTQLEQLRDVARIAAWLLEAESASPVVQPESGTWTRQLEDSHAFERERLAIALHEGVAQDLFALRLQLQQLRTSPAWRPDGNEHAVAAGAAFTRALDRSIGDVCEIANGLLPQGPAHVRVVEAIRQQAMEVARRTGLEIRVHEIGAAEEIDAGTRVLLLRVAREALASAARHARACHVNVSLECSPQALKLRVVDDGVVVGPDALSHAAEAGLAGLSGRAGAVGGTLHLERNARGGTTLTLYLPRAIIPVGTNR
jgi:signal transduction histidine kinase